MILVENICFGLNALAPIRSGRRRRSFAIWHSASDLLENFAVLIEFLSSDRYGGKFVRVASAMAGVPHVRWQTSLKRLNSEPIGGDAIPPEDRLPIPCAASPTSRRKG